MPIKSMTGFAREAGAAGRQQWAWELKTVNGRGLEIRVRTPPGLDALGEEARRLVAASLSRGQCQLTLTVARTPGPPTVRVNRAVLAELLDALADLDLPANVRPASLDGLLSVRGVVEIEDETADSEADEAMRAEVARAAGRLVTAVEAARAGEGAALETVLRRQLGTMESAVAAIGAAPARQPDAIRARLAAQVAALLGAAGELDPVRLHAEAALLATRSDIGEELDRLRAHFAAAHDLIAAAGPVGRRLDFLAQELGREANTLCAKANDVEVSRLGLELKVAVEQFREQVQNVE